MVRFEHVRIPLDPAVHGRRTKTFVYRHWEDHPSGCGPEVAELGLPAEWRHLVYRLPELLAGIRAGDVPFVAEGEKDADNLAAQGYLATSHHGAGTFGPEHAQWFVGAERVVVLMDRDRVGARKAWATLVALRNAGIVRSHVYRAFGPTHKDVSDFLAAGYSVADLEPVGEAWLRERAARTSRRDYRRLGYGR